LRSRSLQAGDEVRVRDVAPDRGRGRFGGGARGAGTVIDRRGSGRRDYKPAVTGQRGGRFEALSDARRRNDAIRKAKEDKIRAKNAGERKARRKAYETKKSAEGAGIGGGRTKAEQEQFLRNKAELANIREKEKEEEFYAAGKAAGEDPATGYNLRDRVKKAGQALTDLGRGRIRKLSGYELERAKALGIVLATVPATNLSADQALKKGYTDAFGKPGGEGTYVDQLEWSKALLEAEQAELRRDRVYKEGDKMPSGRPVPQYLIGKKVPVRGKGRSRARSTSGLDPTGRVSGVSSIQGPQKDREAARLAGLAKRRARDLAKSRAANDKRLDKGKRPWKIDPDTGRFILPVEEMNRGGLVSYFKTGGYAKGGSVDSVPAMLTPGEFVVRKEAVDAVGVDALQNINRMGYNAGGVVYAQAGGGMPFGGSPYRGRGAYRRNKQFRIQQRRMQKQQRIQQRRMAKQQRIANRNRGPQFLGGVGGMFNVPPQPVQPQPPQAQIQPQPPAAPPLLAPPGAVNRPVVPGAGAGGGFVPAALPQAQGGGQAAGGGIDLTIVVEAIVQLKGVVEAKITELISSTTQQQGSVDLSPITALNESLSTLTGWTGFTEFSNAVTKLEGIGPFQVEVPGGINVNLGAFESAFTAKLGNIVKNAVADALATGDNGSSLAQNDDGSFGRQGAA
jgi:hypothetical protein